MSSNSFEQTPKRNSVALLTPTYERDLSLCALLCESVDRHARSFSKHYLLVPDSDLALFARFEGPQRTVLPASQFLPRWLRPLPAIIRRQRRQHWWSLRARPVSGWHIQQILKIASAATLPHSRFCILDSDVVLFRDFDLARFEDPEPLPLYSAPNGITPGHARHARWIETTHRLLGLPTPSLPATDFIGHIIFWDQLAIRSMIRKIENTTGLGWIEALCRTREFSEYLLYGYFVQSEADLLAMHEPALRTGCISYWDEFKLDKAALVRLLGTATADDFAFSATSFSQTPAATIREVVDLQRPQPAALARLEEPARI
ncbi:MAG TPA: DUF6492 family protein [Bradyrhizobium sp.]|uniref:DUF6492 family protein n=1 Tax=Bradyrhizobium sp. TaxID=376 RepID=UPI002D7F8936|nr:DUF6492 family protein [Bradyrhizobium sp.]HET7885044.1 DUF6492 family protein [Bradyrhizobium sp.]